MKLSPETKFFLGIILFTVAVIIGAVLLLSRPVKPIGKDVLAPATSFSIGNKDAKAWLVEFSDFQCPACRLYVPVIKELIVSHSNDFLYVHRHYPLPQHEYAQNAAIAVEAANRQGRFWEMWQKLFDAPALTESTISAIVSDLGMDTEKFASDSADPAIAKHIEDDTKAGNSLGITATPTFYLNGVKLDIRSPEELKKTVEEAINK